MGQVMGNSWRRRNNNQMDMYFRENQSGDVRNGEEGGGEGPGEGGGAELFQRAAW